MSSHALLSKYIRNSEKAFVEVKTKLETETPSPEQITEVVEYAKQYLSDAKYFGEKRQYDTALVSIAYCEGLLDALRLLKLVDFKWPEAKKKK